MSFSVLIDKSPQGFIDEDIIPLLTIINNDPRFETTSSCSGRITLMSGEKKGESKWVYKTHERGDSNLIYLELQKLEDDDTLRFMYEPFIVHLKCKTFSDVTKMLSLLHTNGLKKSSMISCKGLIIEINDTGRMETILNNSLPLEYVEILVNEANKRLANTKNRIKLLEKLYSKIKKE
tara:strand:+ start:4153 stop:4686 length:534 start_codon:yes stop_codon:yes gene_type:complete